MSKMQFTSDEKSLLSDKLKKYLDRELDIEIGQFDAEFLLDFVAKDMGGYFYNKGLLDAQAILESKMDDIKDAIYTAEMPTALGR